MEFREPSFGVRLIKQTPGFVSAGDLTSCIPTVLSLSKKCETKSSFSLPRQVFLGSR